MMQLQYDTSGYEKIKSNNIDKININNRRYLGNKYKLLEFIHGVVEDNCENIKVVADIFGGTGVVAHSFWKKGKSIIVNDILYSNYIMYNTWFGKEIVDIDKIFNIIHQLNNKKVYNENYVSEHFGGSYFTEYNARKIGYIREEIDRMYNDDEINFREKSILITSLIYAADKVANTCGHYDSYRKKLDSNKELKLLMPDINSKNYIESNIYNKDANELVKEIYADLVYIDTPYNSRQYGDSYHLLENIVMWNKPDVKGIAKKMVDRNHLKSKYCTQKAPEAFSDLIKNINARYILVSYNNMAQKGNGRSNAKISNEEIIETLKSKGDLKIFEIDYKAFTTGKATIENHKEILYLCEVKNREYIKSCLNYTGGKYKLLNQIIPLFPKDIDRMVDIFCGGANVGINVQAKKIICNDRQEQLISLFNSLKKYESKFIFDKIADIINKFDLSNTDEKGYKYYGIESNDGLSQYNKEKYLILRDQYNKLIVTNEENKLLKDLMFFVLTVYGFNNQIRFNSKGGYNIPVGKRDFNSILKDNLNKFINRIKENDIEFLNEDFRQFDWKSLNRNDFVYLDPPYLISNATYNEQNGWTEKDELQLLDLLDELNSRGIRFALSNVIEHKGNVNEILKKWSKKYKINYLDYSYKNSNYQKKDKKTKSVEVLITNY